MVFLEGKEVNIKGLKFIVHKAPATVAYKAAMEYNFGQESKNTTSIMNAINLLFKYVELELEDGRKVLLDNSEIVDQHIKEMEVLLELQKEVVAINFTFSPKENH